MAIIIGDLAKSALERVGAHLQKQLRAELLAQSHRATGALIRSIEYDVRLVGITAALVMQYNFYGRFLNNGIPANRIPYTRGSGAGKSKLIEALVDWALQKRIKRDRKEATSFAHAVAQKWKKTGYPSPDSKKYSKNGRIIGFQDIVLEQEQEEIERILLEDSGQRLEAFIYSTINSIQKEIQ